MAVAIDGLLQLDVGQAGPVRVSEDRRIAGIDQGRLLENIALSSSFSLPSGSGNSPDFSHYAEQITDVALGAAGLEAADKLVTPGVPPSMPSIFLL